MNTRDRIAAAASRAPVNAAGDSRSEKEFNSLVSLWNQYFSIVEGIEARYPSLLLALISPLTALCTFQYASGGKLDDQAVPAFMLFAIVLFITLMIFAFLAYQFRYAAMLRGELIRIEAKLNYYFGENVYLWNAVQLNAPKTRGKVNAILFISFLIVIIGLIIVSYAFIEAISPHWIRGLFLLGPFIDSLAQWIAGNSNALLWVPIAVFSVDFVCILLAFANNTTSQNYTSSRTWDIAKYPDLIAETDKALFNVIRHTLRVADPKENTLEQIGGGISAGVTADSGDGGAGAEDRSCDGVSAGASPSDLSRVSGATQTEKEEGAPHVE